MQFQIPFSGRSHTYTSEEIELAAKVMKYSTPLTQGKYKDQFEKKFCEYHSISNAFTVCNATAALEISAQLCQFDPGDEIIAPAHTFTASVYPFLKKGAKVKWADIDLKTRVITAKTIKEKITSKTKAILVVHLYGFMADMPPILEIAKKFNLIVIEDAAQSIGTEMEGYKSGVLGDFGIFSFHSHKNITTCGEGGMLTVRNPEIAEIVPMLRHNGHCSFEFKREDYWIPAMGNVDIPELNNKQIWPSNYCLGEVECALGSMLLDRVDQINNDKRNRALWFIDQLSDFPELEFHRVDTTRHNYHLLVAIMTAKNKRDKFIRKLASQYRIQCIAQYYPLYRYDFYKKIGFDKADCPNTDLFFDNMISFPFHHSLSDEDIEFMLNSTRKVLSELRK